jgi:hypothetical protein
MIFSTRFYPSCQQGTSRYTLPGDENGFAALLRKVCHPSDLRNYGLSACLAENPNRVLTAALAQHEDKILKHIENLDQCIERDALSKKTSEMRDLCFWFSFDAMGDFVFNKSFNMLSSHKWHYVIVRLQNALSLLGPLSPAPWLVQLGLRLGPKVWVLKDWHDSVAWAKGEMRTRLEDGLENQKAPDLTYYLMEQEEKPSFKDSLYWMQGDSLLAIVAGR